MLLEPTLSRRDDHDHAPQLSMQKQPQNSKDFNMHTSNGARARNLTFTTSVIPSRQAHDHTAYAQFTNATNVTLRNTNAIAGNVVLDATNIHWAAVPELQQSIHSLRLTGFVVCLLSWLLYKYS